MGPLGKLNVRLSPRCLTQATPLAMSLLCRVFKEPLGRRFPIPDVPCLFGYVLELDSNTLG